MNLYTIYEDKILHKRIECIYIRLLYEKGVKIVEGSDLPSNQLRHIMVYAYIILTAIEATKCEIYWFRDFGFLSNDNDISITYYIYTHNGI